MFWAKQTLVDLKIEHIFVIIAIQDSGGSRVSQNKL